METIKLTDFQCQALKVPVGSTVTTTKDLFLNNSVLTTIDFPPKPKTSRERFEQWYIGHSSLADRRYGLWEAWQEAERQAKEAPREH